MFNDTYYVTVFSSLCISVLHVPTFLLKYIANKSYLIFTLNYCIAPEDNIFPRWKRMNLISITTMDLGPGMFIDNSIHIY